MTATRNGSRVGIIIVNWNGWRDTVAALEHLRGTEGAEVRAYVVDNASTDSSLEEIRARAPDARLLAQSRNLGFAGGCNVGISAALADGCAYVLLLNNDAWPEPGAVARLVETSVAMNDRAILGSAVRFAATGAYQFIGSRSHPQTGQPRWIRPEDRSELLDQPFIPSDFVFGAALFAPRSLFETVGLMDERYFLNYEETDLCYRARRAGWACGVVPSSVVHHHASASLGAYDGPLQTYFLCRNELLFAERNATPLQFARLVKRRFEWMADLAFRRLTGRRVELRDYAMLQATLDYGLRRFGDCPERIRELRRRSLTGRTSPPGSAGAGSYGAV